MIWGSPVIKEDIEQLIKDASVPWRLLEGRRLLVTGATGLIGSTLVRALCAYGTAVQNPPQVVALVRNTGKAQALFSELLKSAPLQLLESNIESLADVNGPVDYIIHAASQTSSKAFVQTPVDTVFTSLRGTAQVLELARRKAVKGVVYLSSMEVYGTPATDEKITESHGTDLDPMQVRSCYPESKRMCENLCASYASQYGIPVRVIRLTQTIGPGVPYHDGRVFAEFARCVIEGRDLILHTQGLTKRSYLYTADAVTAILTVLLKGVSGEAYNAANEETYCSIYEMANLVAEEAAGGGISVVVDAKQDLQSFGYAPTLHMNLDTRKLRSLGWSAHVPLAEMYRRMIADLEFLMGRT